MRRIILLFCIAAVLEGCAIASTRPREPYLDDPPDVVATLQKSDRTAQKLVIGALSPVSGMSAPFYQAGLALWAPFALLSGFSDGLQSAGFPALTYRDADAR